ncbi:fimbria/pilus outer membrane usher protein [Deinococcus sp. SDU3-2]|uniref:Fimbria/pilus outer membrane usher protein n=1 Tax=Deinococcus terrestris TaxID=2651870 RepID=A0A7X1NUR2_9DEIO|nr:fimbria/pilus outer membrane usher protein [Deinococcus terrestris]MPY66166.1 fimbria/pilus outer membrane usher protein [Deinococcus terrestris]
MSAALEGVGNVQGGEALELRASLGASFVQGKTMVFADLFTEVQEGDWIFSPRARLSYAFTPDLLISGHWDTLPSGTSTLLERQEFRGVSVQGQYGMRRVLPAWDLALPLDAEVVVLLNGQEWRRVAARAGVLRIQGAEVDRQGFHALTAIVTDETGVREFTREFSETYTFLPAGSGLYAASVGWQPGGWTVGGQAEFGLSPQMSLVTSLRWQTTQSRATARLNYAASTRWSHSFGVRYQGGTGTTGTFLDLTTRYRTRQWVLGAAVQTPLGRPNQTVLALSGAYVTNRWSAFGALQGGLATSWSVGGGWAYQATPDLAVTVTGEASPQSWRASVGLTYQLAPTLRAAVAAESAPQALSGSLNVTYQPAPGHKVEAEWRQPGPVSAAYSYAGPVQLSLGVSTAGDVTALAQGALTFTGGRLLVSPAMTQRAIVVQTGVPNLPLLINGAAPMTTNSQGELILTDLGTGQSTEISVDLARLPITVGVGTDRVVVVPPLSGVTVFDWRGNFILSRWVLVRWQDGRPAAGARLELNGQSYNTDDEGYAFLPDGPALLSGQLVYGDGTTPCRIDLAPQQTEITCQ